MLKALCGDENLPISCADDQWPPQELCFISVARSHSVGYSPPALCCGIRLLAELMLGSFKIN